MLPAAWLRCWPTPAERFCAAPHTRHARRPLHPPPLCPSFEVRQRLRRQQLPPRTRPQPGTHRHVLVSIVVQCLPDLQALPCCCLAMTKAMTYPEALRVERSLAADELVPRSTTACAAFHRRLAAFVSGLTSPLSALRRAVSSPAPSPPAIPKPARPDGNRNCTYFMHLSR